MRSSSDRLAVEFAQEQLSQPRAWFVRGEDRSRFFAADHARRQDWFVDDYEAGRLLMLGALFFPKLAAETSRTIHTLLEEVPTVFLPAHDAEAQPALPRWRR